jgi:peroxiredoxin
MTITAAVRTTHLCALIAALLVIHADVRGNRGLAVERGVPQQPAADTHPAPLAIGSAAPPFRLPGTDGKIYTLASFKQAKALVVLFTAVHCPTAEVYEERIKKLVADYKAKDVALVAIQPNNAEAVRLDEMGYTDLGDSLDDMKIRAKHRQFNFPFLYDGEKQEVSKLYGPVATPHVFVFDRERKLRYQGRVDSNPREAYAKVADARLAIDAVLAGTPVPVEKTPAVGCSVKWLDKKGSVNTERERFAKEPVTLEKITVDGVKALRANATDKTILINFWATWCAPCVAEFPDLLKTWRMYRKRPYELVTITVNYPDEEKAVRKFLESQHASAKNYISSTMDPHELVRTLDPDWNGGVPYSMIIAPGGTVLYKSGGTLDVLKTRRLILASFPDDDYVGQNAYWNR